MARIRSIHPGQWTDEDFVSCSFPGQILAIALRGEADDVGVFEWKPVGLKMRLLPAAAVDIAELLAELVERRQIMRFEHGGKSYGAIRNFCAWQRPKEPSQKYPLPPAIAAYVGLDEKDYRWPKVKLADGGDPPPVPRKNGRGSPELPQSFPRASEIGPQREEIGGSRRVREDTDPPLAAAESCHPREEAAAADPVPPMVDQLFARVGTMGVARGQIEREVRAWVDALGAPQTAALLAKALREARQNPMTLAAMMVGRRTVEIEAAKHAAERPPPEREDPWFAAIRANRARDLETLDADLTTAH